MLKTGRCWRWKTVSSHLKEQRYKDTERFHSRNQQLLYKFIRAKESFYIKEKGLTPTRLVWETNMAAVSLFGNTKMAEMTSRENALYINLN